MNNIVCNPDKSLFCEDNILKNILPSFNIYDANVAMVKFKDTDKQRAVYKVIYKNNSYCLKKVYFPEEELLYVYSALEWLHRNDLHVPNLLPSSDKGRFVKYNNMLFILTPWIDGAKCDFDKFNDVISSSLELAKLHKKSEQFTPIEGSLNRKGFDNIYLSNSKHFEQILQNSNLAFKFHDLFSKKYIEDFDINLQLCKISLEISSSIDFKDLSISLCHGDYVNKNLIFSSDDELWMIDFDKCKLDYCVHDLSYFMRRLLKRENTNWNIDIALSILKSYTSYKHLTKSDYKYIISYLAFPQKYWKISKDYYKNINKCNKIAFQTLINKASLRNRNQLEFINDIVHILSENNWSIPL
ncbi:CotS family spore coat protein [Clostridium sp. SHJSY1]|uniref:CotS family spore coat protein n=1 Tax=Clostridium sp. SHJSY1 TaxID=2942483 RepID=UPI002876226B|nr:CotS family spore coat protein [Clostridium sp. SHJSY1]MDS0524041.1 CotS family spore coat protein [Clostridium sp. SHJSY1]